MSVRHNGWHNYRGQVTAPVHYAKMVDCIDGWTPEDFAGPADMDSVEYTHGRMSRAVKSRTLFWEEIDGQSKAGLQSNHRVDTLPLYRWISRVQIPVK